MPKKKEESRCKCAKATDMFGAGAAAVASATAVTAIMQQQMGGGEVAAYGHCEAEEQEEKQGLSGRYICVSCQDTDEI